MSDYQGTRSICRSILYKTWYVHMTSYPCPDSQLFSVILKSMLGMDQADEASIFIIILSLSLSLSLSLTHTHTHTHTHTSVD